MKKIWVSWSSGKDSAWTVQRLIEQGNYEITGLVTTISKRFDRVSMHGVRTALLKKQAEAVGLPLQIGELPWPCPNSAYETVMEQLCATARATGVSAIAFGDLYLGDIRRYREERMQEAGMEAIFPLWGMATDSLIGEMLDGGLKATITCVDTRCLPAELAGTLLDLDLIGRLDKSIDPCGENGEFHTFVWDSPIFSRSIPVQAADFYEEGHFVFRDLVQTPNKPTRDWNGTKERNRCG